MSESLRRPTPRIERPACRRALDLSRSIRQESLLAGLHRPEAVRAVDGLVHAWLEGNLRGIAALRANDREVLAHRAVIAALVAARAADLADVEAARLACGAARCAAARAAFGI